MIYTLTFNPSLDYIITVNDFALYRTNRTADEVIYPGGKGINVSTVLHHLGIPSVALGFTAGFTGDEIIRRCRMLGINCKFISLSSGCSRINIKLKNYEGTEINGAGPYIDDNAMRKLMDQLNILNDGDILVLTGSLPSGLPSTTYHHIMTMLSQKDILFIVDAEKDLLVHTLPNHPFLIKPNHHELGEIFHTTIQTAEDAVFYAKKLQTMGARNVLVSMASSGAVFLSEKQHVYTLSAPKGTFINSVGSGDSMIAGFLAGLFDQKDDLHAFKMSVASGSASAFSEHLATKEKILQLYASF